MKLIRVGTAVLHHAAFDHLNCNLGKLAIDDVADER